MFKGNQLQVTEMNLSKLISYFQTGMVLRLDTGVSDTKENIITSKTWPIV